MYNNSIPTYIKKVSCYKEQPRNALLEIFIMQSGVVFRFVFLSHRYRIIILGTLLGAIHVTVMRAAVDIACLKAGN